MNVHRLASQEVWTVWGQDSDGAVCYSLVLDEPVTLDEAVRYAREVEEHGPADVGRGVVAILTPDSGDHEWALYEIEQILATCGICGMPFGSGGFAKYSDSGLCKICAKGEFGE